ncbi:MAG: pseudouridine synthase [Nodosilinea sp.]
MLDSLLHPLDTWLSGPQVAITNGSTEVDYSYRGTCPRTGLIYSLPRTALAKAAAHQLMAQLKATDPSEGKMYGVLLVQTPSGQTGVLKACSGQGQGHGWVPPIPGRSQVAMQEARTLAQLEAIKERLLTLQQLPERETYARLQQRQADERQQLNQQHRDRKQARDRQRQTLTLTGPAAQALADLEQLSRGDKAELRAFKQRWRDRLALLEATVQTADAETAALKQQRRTLSRQLQAELHAAYTLTNFAGDCLALEAIASQGLPTGTGDCCAPKLLHAAAEHNLKPLAMAEFWWGPAQGDRQPGHFYGACTERCQPIMGFLLSGSGLSGQVLQAAAVPAGPNGYTPPQRADGFGLGIHPVPGALDILYQDEWIVAVDKPAGLLSVPGRYGDRQDSVLIRLRSRLAKGAFLQPVHRLDQDTSGVLVLALDAASHRQLSQQFEQRQVQKTYQAVVAGNVSPSSGLIDLPLWGDPAQRPRQQVNRQRGRPSQTKFEVLARKGDTTRLAFYPLTGRTHQLRVHAADGLRAPIWGDRLYGFRAPGQRLYLHAQSLQLCHPQGPRSLSLSSPVPF